MGCKDTLCQMGVPNFQGKGEILWSNRYAKHAITKCSQNDVSSMLPSSEYIREKRFRLLTNSSGLCTSSTCFPALRSECRCCCVQVAFFIHQMACASTTLRSVADSDDALRLPRRTASQSIASLLVYRSDKQRQLWRFVLYMLVHAG